MYKNQLQELAQRSCFNLPSYACMREGPDHAPRFKATVNFNGEVFESPSYCSTLRQAEHSAAEVALNALATRGPARSLAARVLDETGVYKNLLQEVTHRAGLSLPVYTTVRSGPGHLPVFTCTVDLAGISFTGEPAKTKKQAEKNAAMAAWSALKQLAHLGSSCLSSAWDADEDQEQEQEQIIIARALANLRGGDDAGSLSHHQQLQRRRIQAQRDKHALVSVQGPRNHYQSQQQQKQNRVLTLPSLPPPPPSPAPTGSKLLPFIRSIFPQRSQEPQQLETISSPSPSPTPSLLPLPRDSYNRTTPNMGTFHDISTYPMVENRPTSRTMPVQIRTRLGASIQEVPVPLDEHQLDEDEWLHRGDTSTRDHNNTAAPGVSSWNWANATNAFTAFGSGNTISRSSYSGQQPPQNFNYRSALQPSTAYGNPSSSSSRCFKPLSSLDVSPVTIRSTVPVCSAPTPRRTISDVNNSGSNFVAPAIRIRSVIPVCSAPPVPPGFPSPCDREAAESSHRAQGANGNDEDKDASDDSDKLLEELNMRLQL